MLNAKRIFFIVLSNVGVRLFRRGIYSTSNSQRASTARGFERAHAQKHPNTNGHASTLIKRERTTDYTDITDLERRRGDSLAPATRPSASRLISRVPAASSVSDVRNVTTDARMQGFAQGSGVRRLGDEWFDINEFSELPRSTRSSRRYFESGNDRNRGNGISEIEGKGAMGSAERVGRRASFKS